MADYKTTSLVEWQQTANGKRLMTFEQAHLKKFISNHYADRLLQISGKPLIERKDVYHYVLLEEHMESQMAAVPTVKANINLKLPFRSESFHTIVSCHAHERVSSLPAFLEEVERILLPEGSLIIYGISFTSIWAIALIFKMHYVPFCQRLYSDFEVKKQLNKLDLRFHTMGSSELLLSLRQKYTLDLAHQAHYVLIAKKTVSGMMLNVSF